MYTLDPYAYLIIGGKSIIFDPILWDLTLTSYMNPDNIYYCLVQK